jgi:hypothetical protein
MSLPRSLPSPIAAAASIAPTAPTAPVASIASSAPPTALLRRAALAGALAALVMLPTTADAQEDSYRISQRGTVSQKLGGTLVSLDYSRPLARARTDLFGGVIHWGELWTPGANEATTLEVSREVKLNGTALPPGRWSMWIIPSRVGPWELVLDARDSLFHTQRPELTDEQVRLVVEPREGETHVEALTWAFPRIAQDGATLQLNWGSLEIPLELEVESIEPVTTIAADEAESYVGEWLMQFERNPETGRTLPPAVLTVRHDESGRLLASFPPGVFTPPGGAAPEPDPDPSSMTPQERERAEARRVLAAVEQGAFTYLLVPRAEGIFLLGWEEDGVLLDVEPLYHEFELENGRAVRLTVRDDKDRVMGTSTRNPE